MQRPMICLLAALVLSPAARAEDSRSKLVKGNTQFALELYGKLRAEKGNLFFSPFSISTALAMTSAGARGRTLEQMTDVLHLPEQKELHPALAELLGEVNGGGKKRGYQLRTANALWGQKDHTFLKDFVGLVKKNYGAGFRQADFKGDTEGARKEINDWVQKQTDEKVKELFKKGVLNDRTRLVLANAIYFKGDWASQFKKGRTRAGDFHLSAGKKVKVPLMRQTAKYPYHETKAFQALELPYAGKDLGMVVLLPRKVDGLADLEKDLTPANLAGWLKQLRDSKVHVTLPKFKLTSALSLTPALASLGMTDAFTPGEADFSGIDGTETLYLCSVVHQAFVDVNERGTEAAAATASKYATYSAGRVFRADHPFVFLVRDTRSGSILFLGRVAHPK
jgi:serpin B